VEGGRERDEFFFFLIFFFYFFFHCGLAKDRGVRVDLIN